MTPIEELKSTLRHDIQLHERLREIIKKECVSIGGNSAECLSDIFIEKREIQKEIDSTNRAVTALFENYYRNSLSPDSKNRNEIRQLVEKLRESIIGNVEAIGETVTAIKKSKKDIVDRMKEITVHQTAYKAYANTG